MKEGLIRLTGEKDIFYDSIEKVYRYRMHCPHCGKVSSTCRCYHDLDDLLGDIDDVMADYTCSAKCALLMNDDYEDITEAIREVGFAKELKDLTEEQAKKVIDILTEDGDFDYPHGEDCSI